MLLQDIPGSCLAPSRPRRLAAWSAIRGLRWIAFDALIDGLPYVTQNCGRALACGTAFSSLAVGIAVEILIGPDRVCFSHVSVVPDEVADSAQCLPGSIHQTAHGHPCQRTLWGSTDWRTAQQSKRVREIYGIILRIAVQIHPTRQPNRILRQEPARLRIIPAVAQIEEPAARIRRRGARKAGLGVHRPTLISSRRSARRRGPC